ncbi:sulfurtransferase-like selenium metabolism protein YedF [Vagococcus zengguangii]|uniref:Sulfurtransferase-like selenium metabolism protein YedF n=1 Tax=Vagococcus zengguangii TaxID=2571750 RepID=A0A4D7CVZ8_9ENTE|nr:sulfurtransferase-like selenium metabolism protein YedF [Vagococcus zengguangii]QCI86447.1 sulfurtransferase-like selenium metabolism protein YedF [Vagococcus zengguangii]TLG81303.1 sulfurtransferase-like selenium metabolism protein YedF [Vagococcus zengguangii]
MTSEINIDYVLNLEGEPCPFPAMASINAYEDMQSGEVIEIISDCPQSINNIPVDAKKRGHEVLLVEQDGPTFRYIIKHL